MTTPAQGALRLVRAAAFDVAVVSLALVGHVCAGGTAPSVPVLACLCLFLALPTVWLTGRRRGLLVILTAMGASQFLLHQAFAALAGSPGGPGCHAMASGHAHGTGSVALSCTGMTPAASMHAMSPPMLVAHVVSAVALSVVLARGERALWRLHGWLTWHVPDAPGTVSVDRRPAGPVHARPHALRGHLRTARHGTRAPPRRPVGPAVEPALS